MSAYTTDERALTSFWKFIDLIDYKGGTTKFSEFHHDLVDFVAKPQQEYVFIRYNGRKPQLPDSGTERRRLVLVSRGHLKSTLCSVAYVLWRIWRNPNIRIAVCTATKDLALQFIREVKQYLENEELQGRVWNNRPHIEGRMIPVLDKVAARRRDRLRWEDDFTEAQDKKVVWRADAIQVMRDQIMKEPTIIASSPGSNITGMHFDLVIKDDIINDDTVATDQKIDKTLAWVQDLESVLDPQRMVLMGKIGKQHYFEVIGDEDVVLGTRYARRDYYGFILENMDTLEYSTFIRNVYKNGKDNTDGYTWAEKFNDTVVERLKKRQGARRFASQYLNNILVEEDMILNPVNLRKFAINWADGSSEIKNGYVEWRMKNDFDEIKHYRVKPIIMIDPAISEKKNADYSVIALGGQDDNRNLYIFDMIYGRMTPDRIVDSLFTMVEKWSCNVCHVETIAYQQALLTVIKMAFKRYKPIVLQDYRPKGEKKGRIATYLEPLFNNKMIYVASHLFSCTEMIEEMTYFPQATVKDDIIDTFAMIAEVTQPTASKRGNRRVVPFRAVNLKYGGSR
jgi:predicted phage terminase large subunit-like protein